MMFHLPSSQKLSAKQDRVKQKLGFSEEEGLRFYSSIGSALYESVQSTLQLYSHRKTLVLHRGVSPFLQQLEGLLLRDSKNLISLQLDQPQLEKDTAAVVICEDHVITGQHYSIKAVEELANQSRIVCIKLVHGSVAVSKSLKLEIQPYSIEILSLGRTQVLVRLGKKCKIHSFFSHLEPLENWDDSVLHSFQGPVPQKGTLDPQIEKSLRDQGWEFFPEDKVGESRVFISNKKLNSDWVLSQIKQRFPQIRSDAYESTSLCRWAASGGFYDWWEGRPPDQFLRGGLILNLQCFDVPGFSEFLIELSESPDFVL